MIPGFELLFQCVARCTLRIDNNNYLFYLLKFIIYNVNYKGEVRTQYLGFREKNNFYFPVSDKGSEKCH